MKSKKLTASLSYAGKPKKLNSGGVGFTTFVVTFLIASSVTQANDLQIYAAPTAGKKTLVMMLDTSGSMGPASGSGFSYRDDYGLNCGISYTQTALATLTTSLSGLTNNKAYRISSGTVPSYERNFCYVSAGSATAAVKDEVSGCDPIKNSNGTITGYQCLDRLTRLKDGMFAFLNSEDASLRQVRVGLGNYSANGDGKSGQILVPTKELGAVNSTQRTALKNALKDLTAYNGTPTAHAYAEAAAYLMGTSTLQSVNLSNAPVYFYYSYNNYRQCLDWSADGTSCTSWSGWISGQLSSSAVSGMSSQSCSLSGYNGTCYRKTGNYIISNTDSGFTKSANDTKVSDNTKYETPLPAVADRQSCDGQGVYILSDGAANATDESRSSTLMSAALDTFGGNFSCSGGLSGGGTDAAWSCMGEFAKKLFDKTQNPTGVSIQTAFVGFGATMNNLGNGYVENACRLSSRTQNDRTSDDQCSPTAPSYKTPYPGYGNGGFFIAKESSEITNSVIQFIDNLGKNPISPLSTGAISVPVDALSPQSFQPYGYLRALEPKPGTQNITWTGNLKKYNIQGGALKSGNNFVFQTNGLLNPSSQDIWNNTSLTDGDGITAGGVYSQIKLPTLASPNGYRPLYSDIKSVASGGAITSTDKNSDLFLVTQSATTPTSLLDKFKTDSRLKNLALDIQLKLLNYLGYNLSLSSTQLPSSLDTPKDAFTSMGASIHSFPVQMTYKGTLDADGNLKSTRDQSVLYGSMEGALRIVNSLTGAEQMVFVPAEILQDSTLSKALRKGESDANGVTQGINGAWVADSDYKVTGGSDTETSVVANKMNVYGGMRMGGKSYYGLDVLNPTSPKLLFRILGGTGDYTRMGQTWSKPVLANIRYNNQITRVMIVGGGYDMCYENPRFRLNASNANTDYPSTSCDNKTQADGNAIYIINAKTGERIWWASNANANTNNTNMTHSVVSRISTLDRDGDGLVDHLFFGDLGGQVFRVDLNNAKNTPPASFGKRVVRLANLATKADGTAITNGDQPRFYQPPTLTVHDEGTSTFVMVGIASGDRSTPLDVSPSKGRELMLPLNELTGRPTNKVYGLIDRDIADSGLITGTKDPLTGVYKDITLKSIDITLKYLKENPQNISGVIASTFFPYSKTGMQGWYRSLSSDQNGNPVAGRTAGGVKAFEEEPVAMTGRLIIPVYDPEGTGIVDRQNPCQPRIIGESNSQQFCLPYGACLDAKGVVDWNLEKSTGFQISDGKNQNVLGPGIQGITFGPDDTNNGGNSSGNTCGALTLLGLQQGKGRWECNKILNPIRWYEKYVEAKYN
ncbi:MULTISPECIES: PilC/PilY family type IV pilus protein [unclassified Acinetobacter]|uniref:PilC/PilY family type IV pilus protein n=1 Tax=unclassified Acinetobacter TaxID=196816 RepID=UPI0018A92AF8|nr:MULTISPECIES: PilC/PilY family type IV pilus protein [unclassified Acinetobacter]MBJ9953953.1 pilus assembly protein PilY [Acinetobacter baumannii]